MDTFGQLRRYFDGTGGFMEGHQILKERRIKRPVPLWAKNNRKVQELLLRSFPRLATNPKQRNRARIWGRVIYLYYRLGLSYAAVAEEMSIQPKKVSDIILRVQRASKGESTDGTGRKLGSRQPGRPKRIKLMR